MVDPKAWVRHSAARGVYVDNSLAALNEFSVNNVYRYLSDGCECALCDQILDKSEPVLPIKDFRYTGGDGSNKILNDDFYLLCSPVVRGYALNERKWGIHDINSPLLTFNSH